MYPLHPVLNNKLETDILISGANCMGLMASTARLKAMGRHAVQGNAEIVDVFAVDVPPCMTHFQSKRETDRCVPGNRHFGKKERTSGMTIQAQVTWIDNLQFVARAGTGPSVVMDTPDGGGGASPMELMLMGIAGCTAVDVMTILKKKRFNVERFKVDVSGTRSDDYPRRYTDIHITYVVHGANISPAGVKQAIDLSEKKYCGAMASVNARITHEFRIETPADGGYEKP